MSAVRSHSRQVLLNRHRCPRDGFVDHRRKQPVVPSQALGRVHKRGSSIICVNDVHCQNRMCELQLSSLDVRAGPQTMGSVRLPAHSNPQAGFSDIQLPVSLFQVSVISMCCLCRIDLTADVDSASHDSVVQQEEPHKQQSQLDTYIYVLPVSFCAEMQLCNMCNMTMCMIGMCDLMWLQMQSPSEP